MIRTTGMTWAWEFLARKKATLIVVRIFGIGSAILAVRSFYVQEMLAVLLLFALPFTIIILLVIGISALWDIAMIRLESGIRTAARAGSKQLIPRAPTTQKPALGYRRLWLSPKPFKSYGGN
jgi:hypothetical protein